MKTLMMAAFAVAMLTGCVHQEVEHQSGTVIEEPSGATVTNDWSYQPRDINQRPYGRQFNVD